MPTRYRDREHAGQVLAEIALERSLDADIVLAIPRGGLPLGRAVADALDLPLDVVVAKKIGAPGNPEYAIGAVASDGSSWRNEEALKRVDQSYFDRKRDQTATAASRKEAEYRSGRDPPDVRDKTVLLVDDGVATGSTIHTCIKSVKNSDASRVLLAVPVGPPSSIQSLESLADEVICPLTPAQFAGVGQFYERFDQVSDTQAKSYLH